MVGKDIRLLGDGNMGAQNAFHMLGPRAGIFVGIVDFLKGVGAVSLTKALGANVPVILLCGTLAVIGHNWPVFSQFRGGRGEATTIGVLLMLVTGPIIVAGAISLVTLVKTKNVSLASVPLFVLLPPLDRAFHVRGIYIVYGMALPSLVALTHLSRVWRRVIPQF
jgi:glycerol-3-phosphate acyltransferase PlsY